MNIKQTMVAAAVVVFGATAGVGCSTGDLAANDAPEQTTQADQGASSPMAAAATNAWGFRGGAWGRERREERREREVRREHRAEERREGWWRRAHRWFW
jgi:hypothetical protein